jgi:replicative DNA helicase
MALEDYTPADDSLESTAVRAINRDSREREFMTRLVCHQPKHKEIDDLIRNGVKFESFSEPNEKILRWVLDQYATSRTIPTADQLQAHFPTLQDVALLPPDAPVQENCTLIGLHANVVDAHYLVSLRKHVETIANEWSSDISITELKQVVEKGHRELNKILAVTSSTAKTLAESVDDVYKDFNDSKLGVNWGIQLPFPFLNETLRGLQPAQLMTVVARPGVGKTWFLLMCACSAITGNPWLFTPSERRGIILTDDDYKKFSNARRRVVFVSMEMPIVDISKRAIALLTKLKYPEIRTGVFVDPADETKFVKKLDALKAPRSIGENLLLVTAQTPDQVAAYADQFNADMVIVDGFYLMGGSGEKRWERVQDNLQQMRNDSLSSLRPYVLASQLAQKEDRMAFSQSVEQDSSIIIQLHQNLQDRNLGQIRMQTRKVREGVSDLQYYYKWDVGTMTFTEEGQVVQNGRDDV